MSLSLKEKLGKQYTAAKNSQEQVRSLWDEREQIALAKLANTDQNKRKSRISLGDLSTIVLERTGRTVAQLPSGKIRPVCKTSETTVKVLELALQRYVIPNANSQFPLSTKLFLIDFLSDIYGGMDVLSYWRVEDDYVGPDCLLLSPRDVFWQAGKRNKRDSDVFVSTYVGIDYLKKRLKMKTWSSAAIRRVLKQVEDGAVKPSSREDARRMTINDQSKNASVEWGDTQEFELVTKYERSGRWVTFMPDFDNEIIRDFKGGKFCIISKESLLPMIDSIHGQGAIERGASLDKTINSITNLTHDALKFSIYPITKYNGSAVKRSTLKWQAGAFWNMTDLNAVSVHNVGSSTLNTFLPIQQFLTAKMLNQNGTTSTQISESDKVSGYGKTPEALKAQQARESTMDRVARDRLETFWGDLMEHWVHLLTTKQEKTIEFYVYDDELNIIAEKGENFEMYINDGAKKRINAKGEQVYVLGSAKITVPKGKLKGEFKYYVDTSSSMLKDDAEEHERLTEILTTVLQIGPDAVNQVLAVDGDKLDIGALFKRWIVTGGTKDWDEIIVDASNADMGMGMAQGMTGMPTDPSMGQQMPQMAQPQISPETLAIMQQIQQGASDMTGGRM